MFIRILFLIYLTAPLLVHSAIIVKIKGNRCFVHLEGSAASVGDHLEALDLFGKPRGIIRLDKVKNGKAIATIVDGTVGVNWLLEHTTQTQLNSPDTMNSVKKNKVGIMGSGSWVIVRKDIRETQRHHGWSAGGSLFFGWSIHKLLSINIATGLTYYVIGSEASGGSISGRYSSNSSLHMTGFPHLQLALKLHIPIANKTDAWISAGGTFSKWNNINDNYYVFDRSEFKFQPSGQIMLGIDIKIPNTKYTIPVSIGYTQVQWGGKWFDENVLGKKQKTDHIDVEISEINFQVGISQPI